MHDNLEVVMFVEKRFVLKEEAILMLREQHTYSQAVIMKRDHQSHYRYISRNGTGL